MTGEGLLDVERAGLEPGNVIIVGQLATPRLSACVAKAIRRAQSSYSCRHITRLNPIENAFAKLAHSGQTTTTAQSVTH